MTSRQPPVLHLQPAPIPPNGLPLWSSSNRTILSALSPSSNSLTVWVAPKSYTTGRAWEDENGVLREAETKGVEGVYTPDKAVYMGEWGQAEPGLYGFYKDTFTTFHTAQAVHQAHVLPLMSGQPSLNSSLAQSTPLSQSLGASTSRAINDEAERQRKQVEHMRELAENYMEALEDVVRDVALNASIRAHHLTLLRILSLATLLYFPPDGMGNSLIGEELLDWVNSYGDGDGWGAVCDDANRLAGKVKEWEEEDWESTVCLAILRGPEVAQRLLDSLASSHPEPQISSYAKILSAALLTLPRSKDVHLYPTTASFISAHRRWKDNLEAEISLLCRGKETTGGWLHLENDVEGIDQSLLQEETDRWEEVLYRYARLMLCDEDAVLGVIETEGGGDWILAVGVWGIWADINMTRDRDGETGWEEGGLRTAVDKITGSITPDDDVVEESVMLSLFNSEITTALVECNRLSIWLATHLTDLLEKLNLVDDDDDETFELPLRDHFVIQYADMLLFSNPEYWEMGCEYLSGCGLQGVGRIREIMRRVSLGLDKKADKGKGRETINGDDMDLDEESTSASNWDRFETVNALLKIAADHGLEDERREICRLAALQLLDLKLYGESIAYCVHSGDKRLLAVIADSMLDIYCTEGVEPFTRAVSTIPSSLSTPQGIYQSPLKTNSSGDQLDSSKRPLEAREMGAPLTFVIRFSQFLESSSSGNRVEAAQILMSCFGDCIVPESFMAVLIMDSLSLLEDEDIILNELDTCELLRNVDIVVAGARSAPDLYLRRLRKSQRQFDQGKSVQIDGGKQIGVEDYVKRFNVIRLAASRNLARVGLLMNV